MSAIVFAGGGTGGHIFPSVAVLESLRERQAEIEPLFLVSERAVDAAILNARSLPFRPIPAAPLVMSPGGLARFVWRWGGAVRAARESLRDLRARHDDVRVLSTGGFVSAPVAQAARVERVPLVMLNQDAPPGKANRWIAGRARAVFSTAEVDRAGWIRIPPVVRGEALAPGDASECRRRLGLDPARPTLFVTGASQGARSINAFAAAFAAAHGETLHSAGWQVVHQTGAEDNSALMEAYERAGLPARVAGFFDAMGVCWGAADCAVSRAGAGSVAEAWANRVPVLFLPYPYHRDQHQRLNAEPLARAGAAIVSVDRIDPDQNLGSAGAELLGMMRDPGARDRMRAAYGGLGPVDGARRLADALLAGDLTPPRAGGRAGG